MKEKEKKSRVPRRKIDLKTGREGKSQMYPTREREVHASSTQISTPLSDLLY